LDWDAGSTLHPFFMKDRLIIILGCWTLAGVAFADSTTPPKKAVAPATNTAQAPAKKTPSKTPAAVSKTAPPKATTASHTPTTGTTKGTPPKGTPAKRYTAYRRAPAKRGPAQQASPTSDRFREIQDALAAQGYLKTPSNGVWDKDSMDAMQRFQKDKNLEPTGKLTAKSLSALGLGPKPAETASLSPHQ
jgi:hypothetical protein